MEIIVNLNVERAQLTRLIPNKTQPRVAGLDTATFSRMGALDRALQETPVARPEAISRAQELIGDVKYPPADTIDGIAMLLALRTEVVAGGESQS